MNARDVSFHEATVTAFYKEKGSVHLRLHGDLSHNRFTSAEIEIKDADNIVIDQASVDAISMTYADGEVLTLEINDRGVSVIVQWNDFTTHTSLTHSYRIRGSATTARIDS